MRKRYVSMLLCFILCFALFALPAAAAEDVSVTATYGEDVTLTSTPYVSSSPRAWYLVEAKGDTWVADATRQSVAEDTYTSTSSYTLTGLDASASAYKYKFVRYDYDAGKDISEIFNVTVNPKPLKLTAEPDPMATALTYTGEMQELVTGGTACDQSGEYGQMVETRIEYALGDETGATGAWSTAVPTATDAGSYYVWWRVVPVSVSEATSEARNATTANAKVENYAASTPTCIPASIAPADIADASIELGDALTYTGEVQTQTLASVTVGGSPLTEGTDYTVSGNTGTDAKDYTLTITGKGNYTGTATAEWSIAPASIDADFTVGKMTYTGQPQTPTVTVTATTVDGCAYTVSYSTDGENFSDTLPTFTDVGTYTLHVRISAPNHADEDIYDDEVTVEAPAATPAPTAKPQSPKTGDEGNVELWLALATVSAMACVAVVGRKKAR